MELDFDRDNIFCHPVIAFWGHQGVNTASCMQGSFLNHDMALTTFVSLSVIITLPFFYWRSHAINICLIRITKLVTPRNLTTAKESRGSAEFVINLRVCQTPSDFSFCLCDLVWICKNTIYSKLLTCLYTAKIKCKGQISLNSFFLCYNFYFLDYKTWANLYVLLPPTIANDEWIIWKTLIFSSCWVAMSSFDMVVFILSYYI